MAISNEDLANALQRIADILQEQDENPYRIRAYRKAANSLKKYSQSISELVFSNADLTEIPYVGSKLAEVIKEIILKQNLEWTPKSLPAKPYPPHLLKKRKRIPTFKIYSIMAFLEKLTAKLKKITAIKKFEFAGDFRRKKETIQSIPILIAASDYQLVLDQIKNLSFIKYILEEKDHELIIIAKLGIQISFHFIDENQFAEKLLQYTGSEPHYENLKSLAKDKNISLTQASSEFELYKRLDLDFIPPELRENRGEIIAASSHSLPRLVELSDIKGDLHCHTNETDGSFTLEEMVEAARKQGYQYVAITDHSQSLKITNGMDEKRLLKQIKQIDKLNEKYSDFKILKSMEIDILEDGSLDLSNDVLKELDLTVCSVHSKFRLSLEKQTERIIRAMDNPYFNILGHATGRLISHRPPYLIDMDQILLAAKERHCFIEVNGQPARLDINDLYCKRAKELGVKVAISSDAHTTKGFNFMILGVNQARRGWLEASDVINTYDLLSLKKLLIKR